MKDPAWRSLKFSIPGLIGLFLSLDSKNADGAFVYLFYDLVLLTIQLLLLKPAWKVLTGSRRRVLMIAITVYFDLITMTVVFPFVYPIFIGAYYPKDAIVLVAVLCIIVLANLFIGWRHIYQRVIDLAALSSNGGTGNAIV
jgi:hypothetical protein